MSNALEQARLELPHLTDPCRDRARKPLSSATHAWFLPLTRAVIRWWSTAREGCMVEDVDGNRFLDFNAGIAVVAAGHCHPRVVEAMQEQAARLIHMSGTDFYYEGMVALAEKLAALAPGGGERRVSFGNSGAEAIEGALKLARYATRPREVDRVLRRLSRPHHGRAFAHRAQGHAARRLRPHGSRAWSMRRILIATAARWASSRRPARWNACSSSSRRCSRPSRRRKKWRRSLIEPVQGEGGYIVPPQQFLRRAGAPCETHGILLGV